MLWAVRHKCPSGAQFTFKCYHHWATLVVGETGDRSGHLLNSKEGVTQRDPLAMIAYGIRVLPLIRELWGSHPRVTPPWYANDAGAGGKFNHTLGIFGTCRRGSQYRATTRIRPKVFWSWPRGM